MTVAVILAAGRGLRLDPHTRHVPKPLIKILGKPIIEHTISVLQSVGVRDIVIVAGYLGNHIKRHLGNGERLGVKIRYCYNRCYMLGNAVSLKAAGKALQNGEPFLLLMGDHYFEKAIIEKAVEKVNNQPLLCIDRNPRYPPQTKDATKVLVNKEGYIFDIGKNIPAWNAVDIGLFLLNDVIFEIIRLLEKQKPNLTITDCIKHLTLNVEPVWGCDVSDHLWFDIDTPQDVEFVESFLCEALNCQGNGME